MGRADPLVGRSTEMADLVRALDQGRAGRQCAVLLRGEPGIGKTRLLAETGAVAAERGFAVHSAAADEADVGRPYGVLAQALGCVRGSPDPVRAELARLLVADSTDDPGRPWRAMDAFLDLLETSALRTPTLVLLDDLQWADRGTSAVLLAARRQLPFVPLVVVGACRPYPRVAELERLAVESDHARTVQLAPLSEQDVSQLVRHLHAEGPDPHVLDRVAAAGGNPLLVREVLRSGTDAGLGRPGSALLQRVTSVPDDVLHLLRIAAATGARVRPALVARLAGRPLAALLPAFDVAVAAGLLHEREGELVFRHDLLREAVYESIPGSTRAALHDEIGSALAAMAAPSAEVAQQFLAGSPDRNAEAVGWLRRAAEEAGAGSPATRVDLLERALQLVRRDDPARDLLRADLADALAVAGRAADAETLARSLLDEGARDELAGRCSLVLMQALLSQGRWSDLVAEVQTGCSRPDVSDLVRARLLAHGGLARMWIGDPDGAERDAQAAVDLAQGVGDDVAESLGLAHLMAVAGGRAEPARGLALARQGLAAARSAEAMQRHPHLPLAIACLDNDLLEEAETVIAAGRAVAERQGSHWVLPLYHTLLGIVRWYRGDWDDAVAEIEAGLATADESGAHTMQVAAYTVLALTAVHRNELGAAGRAVAAGEDVVRRDGPQWWLPRLLWAKALLLQAQSRPAEALAVLTQAWDQSVAVGFVEPLVHLGPDLVRAAIEGGERAQAASAVELLDRLAVLAATPTARGAADLARGLLRRDAQALRSAVDAYRASGRACELAAACHAAGLEPLQAGGPADVDLLLESAAVYERLSAGRDLSRLQADLRELGVRRGAAGPRPRAKSGWAALTRGEVAVVRLAVQGRTNPQIAEQLFLSRRTVQTHLSHVFAKLGIASRVELAAEAARREEFAGDAASPQHVPAGGRVGR